MLPLQNTNIVAIATPSGAGAIGIIRISGPEAIAITQQIFKGKKISRSSYAYPSLWPYRIA